MKKLLALLLMCSIAQPKMTYDHHRFNISMTFRHSLKDMEFRSSIFINSKRLRCCQCNESPVIIIFVYSHFECYCIDHMPQFNHKSVEVIEDTVCSESIKEEE